MTSPETPLAPLMNPSSVRLGPTRSNEDSYVPTEENSFVSSLQSSWSSNARRLSAAAINRRFSSFTSINIFKDGDLFLMNKRRPQGAATLLQGPRRILRLCIFGTILPVLLISIPLYARLVVFPPFHYSMAPTDQRLIYQKSSSVWCQAQTVKMNGTFNAFLMSAPPSVKKQLPTYTMLKHLTLKDDVKEYWGFFLQKGSIITIKLCTRYDGGMLMIMRGRHNLRKCAWIRDEESAEWDEDHMDESNESGEPPEIYLDVPIVRKDSGLLMERGGHLVKMNITLQKETLEKTSAERKLELDYYIQKAIQLSKHKKEIFRRVNYHTKNWIEKEKTVSNNSRKEQRDNKKITESIQMIKNVKPMENLRKVLSSSKILEKIRLKRSLDEDQNNNAMEIIDDETMQRIEAKHSRQNSSTEVSNHTMEMYLKLFHLPNGLIYERGKFDTRTVNDSSNEEERSSFSSSEEALLACDGLLGLMPLYQNPVCNSYKDTTTNRIRYKIPITGTYYFVFSSDNEVYDSEIYFNMTLQRVEFDTESSTSECLNQTKCSFPFSFWSYDQTVVTLPESDWDASYVLDVTCQPRVAIYLSILIMVPIAIIFCTLY